MCSVGDSVLCWVGLLKCSRCIVLCVFCNKLFIRLFFVVVVWCSVFCGMLVSCGYWVVLWCGVGIGWCLFCWCSWCCCVIGWFGGLLVELFLRFVFVCWKFVVGVCFLMFWYWLWWWFVWLWCVIVWFGFLGWLCGVVVFGNCWFCGWIGDVFWGILGFVWRCYLLVWLDRLCRLVLFCLEFVLLFCWIIIVLVYCGNVGVLGECYFGLFCRVVLCYWYCVWLVLGFVCRLLVRYWWC